MQGAAASARRAAPICCIQADYSERQEDVKKTQGLVLGGRLSARKEAGACSGWQAECEEGGRGLFWVGRLSARKEGSQRIKYGL